MAKHWARDITWYTRVIRASSRTIVGWWWVLPLAWFIGPSSIPPRAGVSKLCAKPIDVTLKTGQSLRVRINEIFGVLEVFVLATYDSDKIDWTHCRCIVDVGANVGVTATWFRMRAAAATIVAIEPDAETVARLHANLARNDVSPSKVRVVNAAVGRQDGFGHIISEKNSRLSFVTESDTNQGLPVRLLSFRHVLELAGGKVDVMKLDCEGAEYGFIESASVSDLASVTVIIGEYHPARHTVQGNFFAKLAENGFAVVRNVPNRHEGNGATFIALRA